MLEATAAATPLAVKIRQIEDTDTAFSFVTSVTRRRSVLVAAGLAAVVAIAAIVFFAIGSGESATGSTGEAGPGVTAAGPETPPDEPEEQPAALTEEPQEVRLDLGALPVGARVTLNDKEIEYPFVLRASPETGNLKITAPGYSPFEATIPLDRDREVAVVWEKEPPKTRPAGQPRPPGESKTKGKKQADGKPDSSKEGVLLPSPFD